MTAITEAKASKLLLGARLAGLLLLFLCYVPPHLLSRWFLRRSRWPQRFLRHAALICGVRPSIEGASLQAHSLAIANHTSWLDILILGGWTGSAFVSKAEVRDTPLLGWIADQNQTLYVDRGQRSDAHGQVRCVRKALGDEQPLVIFPEGTTGDGRHLLPFRSTLRGAVAPPPEGVAVRPVALDYGEHASLVGWHGGEAGMTNIRRVLGHPGTIAVTIRLLEPLAVTRDRKALASEARRSIAAALSSLGGRDVL